MNRKLNIFATITAGCTLFLIFAGGMVTSTGSALAVPDWPLSYGQLMPPMVGGIFYEHGHRMIASFVGLLTVILAVWLWRVEQRRWVRIMGLVAVFSVIAQGTLGGLTVLFLLPTPISVTHASLAQSFFCLVTAIALVTSSWWHDPKASIVEATARPALTLSVSLASVIFLQLLLGAIMRHTQSGLAVPDLPLAYGNLFPSLSADALERYNQILLKSDIRIAADGPLSAFQVLIHLLHRFWALVVVAIGVITFLRLRTLFAHKRIRTISWMILSLLTVQITLGVFTVLTRKAELITTFHVATGALLLVSSVILALHLVRLGNFSVRIRERSLRTEALA